ncbi:MAG: hypothetical protein AABY10_05045 [Nanoarchaeota archaeon]
MMVELNGWEFRDVTKDERERGFFVYATSLNEKRRVEILCEFPNRSRCYDLTIYNGKDFDPEDNSEKEFYVSGYIMIGEIVVLTNGPYIRNSEKLERGEKEKILKDLREVIKIPSIREIFVPDLRMIIEEARRRI